MNEYAAMIKRALPSSNAHLIVADQERGFSLADAIEALTLAERDAVAERNAVEDQRDALARRYDDLVAERDALRAQLDGMTEHFGWAHKYGGLIFPYTHEAGPEGEYNIMVRRLVGPWVEVE